MISIKFELNEYINDPTTYAKLQVKNIYGSKINIVEKKERKREKEPWQLSIDFN